MQRKISRYEVLAPDGQILIGFGPRYSRRPQDDTTCFGIEHRTTGGYVGVLFEREEFRQFAQWLSAWEAEDAGLDRLPDFVRPTDAEGVPLYVRELGVTGSQFRLIDGQTMLTVTKMPEWRMRYTAHWLGYGNGRSVELSDIENGLLANWAADKDAHGWEGWRSGRDGTPEA